MEDLRYLIACARLASLSDVKAWTRQDLLDVVALCDPPVPFDVWRARACEPQVPQPGPAPLPPDRLDPQAQGETDRSLEFLLGPGAEQLRKDGIVSVVEVPA